MCDSLETTEEIFAGWDHGLTPQEMVEAGRLFKRFRKRMKKVGKKLKKGFKKVGKGVLKVAKPVLSIASTVYPALAPAAAAVSAASRLVEKAEKGSKAAKGAMRAIAHHAKQGDTESRKMLATMREVRGFRKKHGRSPKIGLRARRGRRINPRLAAHLRRNLRGMSRKQLLDLITHARQNRTASGEAAQDALEYIAGLADGGDDYAQHLIADAAGEESGAVIDRWGAILSGEDPDDEMWDEDDGDPDMEASGEGWADQEIISGQYGVPEVISGQYGVPEVISGQHGNASGHPDVVASTAQQSGVDHRGEIIAGGPVWDALKPRWGYRSEDETWGPRDNYQLGLQAVPATR